MTATTDEEKEREIEETFQLLDEEFQSSLLNNDNDNDDDEKGSNSNNNKKKSSTTQDKQKKNKTKNVPPWKATIALLKDHALKVFGMIMVVVTMMVQKCKESTLLKKFILKCRESQWGQTIYHKFVESPIGKYAKKQHAANPQKAKQQLYMAAGGFGVVLLLLLLLHGSSRNRIPKSKIIMTKEGVIPNILFVGAPQSGVPEVSEWLYHNTDICAPKVLEGPFESSTTQVGFFNRPKPTAEGLPWYSKRFHHCQTDDKDYDGTGGAALIMDATPLYMHVASVVSKFYLEHALGGKKDLQHLKIVMIVREPVERDYWEYMAQSSTKNLMSFERFISDVKAPCLLNEKPTAKGYEICPPSFGHYAKTMESWVKHFKRNQILVLHFEELEHSPKIALNRLETFLGFTKLPRGISSLVMPPSASTSSTGKTIKADALPTCTAQHILQTIYEDWNDQFYDIMKTKKGIPPMEQRPFPTFELSACKE